MATSSQVYVNMPEIIEHILYKLRPQRSENLGERRDSIVYFLVFQGRYRKFSNLITQNHKKLQILATFFFAIAFCSGTSSLNHLIYPERV